MKNEINQITEEKYWEEMEKIGPYDYDGPFPKNPCDEDAPYTTLDMDFEKHQKELQKEAEEKEYRERLLGEPPVWP